MQRCISSEREEMEIRNKVDQEINEYMSWDAEGEKQISNKDAGS